MKLFSFAQVYLKLLDLTQLPLIYSDVSNFTQNLNKFFSWPKFDESCWNYHMIPVHSRVMSNLPSGAKKNGKIISDYFAVFPIILPLIWPLIWLSWENKHYLTCECSCILYSNVENFARIMPNFSALGMQPHPLHRHAVRL